MDGGGIGLKTLTSRKVRSNCPLQKPFAAISSFTPSVLFEELRAITLPDKDCRSGSTQTSVHTSVAEWQWGLLSRCGVLRGSHPWGKNEHVPLRKLEGVCGGGHP